MLPFTFGEQSRRLFGTFHARPSGAAPRRGVLLCNAFGHEAIQLHRLNRVLADRLSREGCDVLRFDYFGAGDSAGDDFDADFTAWSGDILTAHRELMRRAGVPQVAWVAFRAGTVPAELAAAKLPTGLRRLVIVDPIIDGREYLDDLRTQQYREISSTEFPASTRFREDPAFYMDEAMGFAITRHFCDQLRAIRFRAPSIPVDTSLVCDSTTPQGLAAKLACASAGPQLRLADTPLGADWAGQMTPPAVLKMLANEAGAGA